MATLIDVYNSICDKAQELIDTMDEQSKVLSEDQFAELQRKIDKIHKYIEDHCS